MIMQDRILITDNVVDEIIFVKKRYDIFKIV